MVLMRDRSGPAHFPRTSPPPPGQARVFSAEHPIGHGWRSTPTGVTVPSHSDRRCVAGPAWRHSVAE
eukprot:797564-Prymnesium_polylepis.1